MNRPVPVGLVALVVVVIVAGVGGPIAHADLGGIDPADVDQSASTPHASTTAAAVDGFAAQDFDTTSFEITVHENGSATWTFRYEQRLVDSDAEASFESFADEFENEETGLYDRFTDQAQALTETGAEATDREMEATAFNRSAGIEYRPGSMGVIEMSFRWDGFAVTENGTVVVGDVFQNTYIASDQSIEIEPGGDLVFASVSPEGEYRGDSLEDASSVTWTGEREFLDGQPSVVLEPADEGAGDGGDIDAPISEANGAGDRSWSLLVGLLVATIGASAAVVWYRRARTAGETVATAETGFAAAGPDADANADADPDSSSGADGGPLTDDELQTDEDRVVSLIRENGGRMKQVNIVDETGWSKSKVSMLLSDMEEEGTISKLRVGRENIISLEGFEPEATKSPFDE